MKCRHPAASEVPSVKEEKESSEPRAAEAMGEEGLLLTETHPGIRVKAVSNFCRKLSALLSSAESCINSL
jgi:hypothetical protein